MPEWLVENLLSLGKDILAIGILVYATLHVIANWGGSETYRLGMAAIARLDEQLQRMNELLGKLTDRLS